jgi:hypothetical protein
MLLHQAPRREASFSVRHVYTSYYNIDLTQLLDGVAPIGMQVASFALVRVGKLVNVVVDMPVQEGWTANTRAFNQWTKPHITGPP